MWNGNTCSFVPFRHHTEVTFFQYSMPAANQAAAEYRNKLELLDVEFPTHTLFTGGQFIDFFKDQLDSFTPEVSIIDSYIGAGGNLPVNLATFPRSLIVTLNCRCRQASKSAN